MLRTASDTRCLYGVVDPASSSEVLDHLNDVARARIDGVRGTALLCELQTVVLEVDRNNLGQGRDGGGHDRGSADGAHTEDSDGSSFGLQGLGKQFLGTSGA